MYFQESIAFEGLSPSPTIAPPGPTEESWLNVGIVTQSFLDVELWDTIPTFNQDSSVGPGGAMVGLGDKHSNYPSIQKYSIHDIQVSGYHWYYPLIPIIKW